MPGLIRPHTCGNCPLGLLDPVAAEIRCRARPPTAGLITAVTQGKSAAGAPELKPVVLADWALFPKVLADEWCAQHPRIAAELRAGLLVNSNGGAG